MSSAEGSFKVMHLYHDPQGETEESFVLSMQLVSRTGNLVFTLPLTDGENRELANFAEKVTHRIRQTLREML